MFTDKINIESLLNNYSGKSTHGQSCLELVKFD